MVNPILVADRKPSQVLAFTYSHPLPAASLPAAYVTAHSQHLNNISACPSVCLICVTHHTDTNTLTLLQPHNRQAQWLCYYVQRLLWVVYSAVAVCACPSTIETHKHRQTWTQRTRHTFTTQKIPSILSVVT